MIPRRWLAPLLFVALAASRAPAQEPEDGVGRPSRDPLVERLTGNWTITRRIRGREVHNSSSARGILDHQFLELRMTGTATPPSYEALVLIGYCHADRSYVAYWCDSYGGKFSTSGVGRRTGENAIEFEFRYPEGPFFNTFTRDEKSATWTSRMERSDANGRRSLFAEDVYRRS